MTSDHFSGHAVDYARHRPDYPAALFDWIAAEACSHDLAWDCGCGNGQASVPLARHFRRVIATDLSAEQIAAATPYGNVSYRVATAEQSGLEDASADALTVAQALHWFDFDRHYAEVRRVVKPGGLIVAWTYQLLRARPDIDAILLDFYENRLGPFWPAERRWVDGGYRDLPFPFERLATPAFEIRRQWLLADLLGYLGTWSATRRCIAATGEDPIPALGDRLAAVWHHGPQEIIWPLALVAGRR